MPSEPFSRPSGTAVDGWGNIYVNSGIDRLDVFDPAGHFITEVQPSYGGETISPSRPGVDSEGNLYMASSSAIRVFVLPPKKYVPENGNIAYESAVQEVAAPAGMRPSQLAVLPNDHVLAFSSFGSGGALGFVEFGTYAEGNPVLRTFSEPESSSVTVAYSGIAVNFNAGLIYVNAIAPGTKLTVQVLDFDGHLLEEITGVDTPQGFRPFPGPTGSTLPVAVDEETGNLFIGELDGGPRAIIYELNPAGDLVSTIEHGFENSGTEFAYDNSEISPNQGYLYVPSGISGTGHLYAFAPKREPKPPIVADQGFSRVSTSGALLEAKVNPNGLPSSYRFEYVRAEAFERDVEELGPGHGFDHAVVAGSGTLPNGLVPVPVSMAVESLLPGTAYRFRVVATSNCKAEEACVGAGPPVAIATFPEQTASPSACPNQALRVGPSAVLPDCRAYELVTPPSTNSQIPQAVGNAAGQSFNFSPVSMDGTKLSYLVKGGTIGRAGGTGSFNGDVYVAARGSGGWQTIHAAGPTGAEAANPLPGVLSPDQEYSLWTADGGLEGAGSLVVEGREAVYVRSSDGTSRLLGQGSLGVDLEPEALAITAGAGHTLFRTRNFGDQVAIQIEPAAPPTGTAAIYDRTVDGTVHVVSLLPGEVTPAAGEGAVAHGASADGSVIAFGISNNDSLYLRIDNRETLAVSTTGATFAGLSSDGHYLFFLKGGDLFRFDTETGVSEPLTDSHDATPVNVSADGSTAYLVSPTMLNGEANPNGDFAQAGDQNLYRWHDGTLGFVATLTEADVKGEANNGVGRIHALGWWAEAVSFRGGSSRDPSRSTPDGDTLLFESGAKLGAYDPQGHRQVYRYDPGAGELTCLSCDPTLAVASTDASLATVGMEFSAVNPLTSLANLSADGNRAFFETAIALVPRDTNGVTDVYEWEAPGAGTCAAPTACISLISSGHGATDSYLAGATVDGSDVFIQTAELLSPFDIEATRSIYNARVNGGFPTAADIRAECLGEACQPAANAPSEATPGSLSFQGAGNVRPEAAARCPKGERKVRKVGKWRCVSHRKNSKKKHHQRTKNDRRAAR